MLNALDGFFLKQIRDKFTSLDYIVNAGYVNAKNFGVPQHRERALIIGSLSRSVELPIGNGYAVTVRDAISDLDYLESGEGVDECEYQYESKTEYQKMLRGTKLYNHRATSHNNVAIMKLKMIPPEGDKKSMPIEYHGKQKFATTWSRLRWNDVSPTIDTRFDTPSNGRNSHPYLNRAITPREAARIQSFDDDFVFTGVKTSICRQMGNAVPPMLAKEIGLAVINAYRDRRYENNRMKLFCADALSLVKELQKDGVKVDHIITDPPYKISKRNNFITMNNATRKGIDFGVWDKEFDICGWINEYVKLLSENGSIIVFCSYLHISHIIDELELHGITTKDVLVWKKSNPMPRNVERRYVQDMEFAIWGVKKNAKWIFNKPPKVPYLRSVFETSTVAGGEKTGHPTQKSLSLMEQIIHIHSKKNEIVLDPFMGSGTTGVAALKSGRQFIGIENNEQYFKIAADRLHGVNLCDIKTE